MVPTESRTLFLLLTKPDDHSDKINEGHFSAKDLFLLIVSKNFKNLRQNRVFLPHKVLLPYLHQVLAYVVSLHGSELPGSRVNFLS